MWCAAWRAVTSHFRERALDAAAAVRRGAQVADFVVRAEFYRAIVFPEATARAGERCVRDKSNFSTPAKTNAYAPTPGGRIVDKEVVVLDVGGVSLGILKIMPLFKAVNSVGSSYFPERTVHILVLNAPRVFASLWSIVRCAGRLRLARRVRG
jgi:hypothetical protein